MCASWATTASNCDTASGRDMGNCSGAILVDQVYIAGVCVPVMEFCFAISTSQPSLRPGSVPCPLVFWLRWTYRRGTCIYFRVAIVCIGRASLVDFERHKWPGVSFVRSSFGHRLPFSGRVVRRCYRMRHHVQHRARLPVWRRPDLWG